MTAIKPATPLPWHQDHERIGAQYRHISMSIGTDGSTYAEQKQNAAYVVAAANAYPELVADNARLREALELADATIRRLKPPVPYDSTQGTRDVISAALAGVQS